MKQSRFLTPAALLLALALLLTGCGAKSQETMAVAQDSNAKWEAAAEAPAEVVWDEAAEAEEAYAIATAQAGGSGEMTVEEVSDFTEKIIYFGSISMETTDFDGTLTALDQAVRRFGGFVQDSNVEGSTYYEGDTVAVRDRWANYTVRIPSDQFDFFMTLTEGIGNVTSSGREAQNVTSQYTDYEARLDSLNTQEERLLAMLEQSGDLESLITLEERLSEVRYEIESIERNLRNLDQKLSYSTVTLYIQEVELYTPAVTVQRSFGEKLSDSFTKGWSRFGRRFQNFIIDLAGSIPTLLLWAVIIAAAVLIGIRVRKRRAAKKQSKKETKDETQAE